MLPEVDWYPQLFWLLPWVVLRPKGFRLLPWVDLLLEQGMLPKGGYFPQLRWLLPWVDLLRDGQGAKHYTTPSTFYDFSLSITSVIESEGLGAPRLQIAWPARENEDVGLWAIRCMPLALPTQPYKILYGWILIFKSRLYRCFVAGRNPLLGAQTCHCPISIEELFSFSAYSRQRIHQPSSSCSRCVFIIIWPISLDKPSSWFWFCSFGNFRRIFSSHLTAYIKQNNCPTSCLFLSYI